MTVTAKHHRRHTSLLESSLFSRFPFEGVVMIQLSLTLLGVGLHDQPTAGMV